MWLMRTLRSELETATASPDEPKSRMPVIPFFARWMACFAWVSRSSGGSVGFLWENLETKKVGTGTYTPEGGAVGADILKTIDIGL